MRIAFCIFKYFPYGGIQRDMMKFAMACAYRGAEVRVYTCAWEGEQPPELEVCIAPVRALANHTRYDRFADWVVGREASDPSDLVVGMNKMRGLDVYYAGDSCFEQKVRTQRSWLYRLTGRYRSFHRAEKAVFSAQSETKILTISDLHLPDFQQFYGTQPERFFPLPPGIERDRRAPSSEEERSALRAAKRADLGHDDDELLLLFLGSGFIKKGLDRVLRALEAMPENIYERLTLYVVGRDKSAPFRKLAKRLGVSQRVRFFDQGRDDVPELLLCADGLALPAYDENAGMVILEAMIAGLPAVVTKNCGYAHYLSEARAGIVTAAPYDQSIFNADLVRLLVSEERDGWSEAGRGFAENETIYQLVPTAVAYFEQFAADKQT